MTARERLISVLRKEKYVDRPAWSPLIDGYFMSSFPSNKDIIEVFLEIGADVMERHVHTWEGNLEHQRHLTDAAALQGRGSVEHTEQGVTVSVEMTNKPNGTELKQQFRIPGRTLTARWLFMETSPFVPFPVEMLIKDVEDLEAYEYIVKRERFVSRYPAFVAEDSRIGEHGIATDSGLNSPIQVLLEELIGIEPFYTKFYVDHQDRLISVMHTMHERNMTLYEIIAESPAEVVIDYEDTSTSFISPELYKQHSLPAINDYADILHDREKIFLTHRCGLLKGLLEFIREGREDGICDISPPPTGNLDIWDAKEALPGKVLVGGIDPTFLCGWSSKQIRDYVREMIVKSKGLDRIIVGSADAVPKNAKIENLKAVSEVLDRTEPGGVSASE